MTKALYTPTCSVCRRPYSEGPCVGHPSTNTRAPLAPVAVAPEACAPSTIIESVSRPMRKVTVQRRIATSERPLNREQRRRLKQNKRS